MQKRDFETCQKRFRDFEILPKFSETHVFRGTIRHPLNAYEVHNPCDSSYCQCCHQRKITIIPVIKMI